MNDLLPPPDLRPDLYDKASCMILAEDALKAIEMYENTDIELIAELLAIKNSLNYYEDENDINDKAKNRYSGIY